MEEKALYFIWLSNAFRPGSSTPKLLLTSFPSAKDIYEASREDYSKLGLSDSDVRILCNKDLTQAYSHLNFCKTEHVGILCYDDPFYPERLKLINNPPPMFYYKGRLCQFDDYPCITMVGTRSCSEKGFRLAYETAYDAASKGAVIVNGLALGIDGACIAACLDANGYAVGILSCGIDRVYPAGNGELFKRLCASGLILSEFAPFTKPEGRNFPVRNRVLSALSLATCVFEADAEKSGAMITAEHALSHGRRIFAVPGKPYDKSYSGPLELIKNGAEVLTEADDILSEYSLSFPHRINLANKNSVPKDKLDRLVSMYFKKGTDPDAPVNRRFIPPSKKVADGASLKNSAPATESSFSKPEVFDKKSDMTPITHEQKTAVPSPVVKAEPTTCELDKNTSDTKPDFSFMTPIDMEIYNIICKEGCPTADDIAANGVKIEKVLASVTMLEVYGYIRALPGGRYESVIK